MNAVVGYVIAAVVAVVIARIAAGPGPGAARHPSMGLADVAGRHVSILGGLAGFAVTGMVLLVTLGRNLPDASGTSFTTLLTMFFVAYIGFLGTSLMFANITDAEASGSFDVPAAIFAAATVTQFYTVAIGWFALRPLFETFGLPRLADLAGWILAASTASSYALVASQLQRSGFVRAGMTGAIAVIGVGVAIVYAILAGSFGWRSPDSTLSLVMTAIILGAPAYAFVMALPMLARDEGRAGRLGAVYPAAILAYSQGAVVFVTFLLLSVLGLV